MEVLRNGRHKKVQSRKSTMELVIKGIAILQLFAMSQFPITSGNLAKAKKPNSDKKIVSQTMMKRTKSSAKVELARTQHWGTLRARLEIAISQLIDKASEYNQLLVKRGLLERVNSQDLPAISETSSVISRESNFLNQDDNCILDQKSEAGIRDEHSAPLLEMKIQDGVFEVQDVNANQPEAELKEKERELILLVRKVFCPALRNLIEHGLILNSRLFQSPNDPSGESNSKMVVSGTIFGCLPILSARRTESNMKRKKGARDKTFMRSLKEDSDDDFSDEDAGCSDENDTENGDFYENQLHAWKLFLFYYELKNGSAYNDSPARKLSQSFDLNVVSGKTITNKQMFLSSLGTVIQNHGPYKRSNDSKFKAIVSMALNERRLSSWLKLIVKNRIIIDSCYHPWSYTASTKFYDALESLCRLNEIPFDLPVDVNIRHLRNINDAF